MPLWIWVVKRTARITEWTRYNPFTLLCRDYEVDKAAPSFLFTDSDNEEDIHIKFK